ncbi:hypothetical protein B0A69_20725 [Chryseobacterium shigense]|uniref:DNA-binding transcriptional regulator, XRE-family HTH domain n=1 Tax=Chryseobacterium shigense TaxID=297244 RepID=A0A1N7IC42_9FLAO|nr:helix-turn-helix transcriptional regulator [Chryseobacterium shigense]PQA90229.1 hypothetical protein B0A69_20725 [Chryseobacterium shigense]SIS34592.1 DNA-binding transcriptional regulator, XRE-family HTH domain [Chryseobacterium shigense]
MKIQENLKKLRIQMGFSQLQLGQILGTDASNYSRKERGKVKIYDDEWEKLAKALNVPLEDIKDHQEKSALQSQDQLSGSHITYLNVPDFILETQQKYIEKLEKENMELLKENIKLKTLK